MPPKSKPTSVKPTSVKTAKPTSVKTAKTTSTKTAKSTATKPVKSTKSVASTTINVDETYQAIGAKEHVRKKDMWAGVRKCATYHEFAVSTNGKKSADHVFLQRDVNYPAALLKCVDEALVNALDHMVEMRNQRSIVNRVSEIDISLDKKTGVITVFNNGRGIPTDFHKASQMYTPQLIFGELFAGSNIDKDKSSITGGTNGVGIKLTNIYADWFEVETVYSGTKYIQKWENSADVCGMPDITSIKEADYTKLTFLPSYKSIFECKFADIKGDLEGVMLMRTYVAAAYAGWTNSTKIKPCKVSYNGSVLPVMSIRQLAELVYPGTRLLQTSMSSDGYVWDVVVAFAPNDTRAKKNSVSISNVNGIYVRGGSHIDYVLDQIVANVKETINKELKGTSYTFKPYLVYSNVAIFMNAQIPDIGWEGQRKDQAIVSKAGLSGYVLDAAFLKNVVKELKDKILQTLCPTGKILGADALQPHQNDETIAIEKYTPAKFSRDPKKRSQCFLMLPEGDSARGMISKGLTTKDPKTGKPYLGYDYYGILTLRGVIINARKNITENATGLRISDKLTKNIFFQNLIKVVGLNLNHKYDPESSTYAAEMKKLRYGAIIGCVDQDHDGVGFIFSLIINLFELFFPELLKAGFVKRFATPVRRAYAKRGKDVIEFYSDNQYRAWAEKDPEHNNEVNYRVEYIKGLATNTEPDIRRMFARFKDTLYTYYPDEETPKWYEDLFGKDAEKRKALLSQDQQFQPDELTDEQYETKVISCSDHALYEAESHKRENLHRKLWSPYDGLNESGRKIVSGAIKKLSNNNQQIKVAQLASFIANSEHYHYGDSSIENAIFTHGNTIVGANQLPPLLPISGFLNRSANINVHGAARYSQTMLNKPLCDVLYPADDMPVLEYVFDDAVRVEPKYFVPIVPTAILESINMPADGWAIEVWGRDVHAVIDRVEHMVKSVYTDDKIAKYDIPKLPPNLFRFKGEYREINNKSHSIGAYTYNKDLRIYTITELPWRTYPDTVMPTYNKKIKKGATQMFKYPPANRTSEDEICIEVELAPPNNGVDPYDIINNCATDDYDGATKFFGLYDYMNDQLNMMLPSGAVKSYDSYEDILKDWFIVRRDLYDKRFARKIAVLNCKIKYLENIIRYIKAELKFDIRKVDIDTVDEKLTKLKFDRIHAGAVNQPKFRTPEELDHDAFHSEKASYKYLLSISDYDRLKSSVSKKEEELRNYHEDLDAINEMIANDKFVGQSVWLEELTKLRQVVKEGQETYWNTKDDDDTKTTPKKRNVVKRDTPTKKRAAVKPTKSSRN